jgi:hypothetical protein
MLKTGVRLQALLAAGLISSLLACGGSSTPSELSADDRDVLNSVRSLLSSPDSELSTIGAAESLFVTQCMAAEGFVLLWPVSSGVSLELPFAMRELSVESAQSTGYRSVLDDAGLGSEASSAREQEEADKALQQGGEEMGRALFGNGRTIAVQLPDGSTGNTVENGCLADARREIWGDDLTTWAVQDMVSKNVLAKIVARTSTSDEVESATEEWTDCMSRAGFDFSSVDEAVGAAGTANEIAVASADSACRVESNITFEWTAQFESIAADVMGTDGPQLSAYLDSVKLAAAKAADLVGSLPA